MEELKTKGANSKLIHDSGNLIYTIRTDFKRNWSVYILFLPVAVYYIIFSYIPMNGIIMAFQDYNPALGIFKSPWVGFEHYIDFFKSIYVYRLFKNTILLSVLSFIFQFPAPIILALLLNEVRQKIFKKVVQTVTYIPYFISMAAICGIIRILLQSDGIVNKLIEQFGGESINFLLLPQWFRTIVITSNLWTGVGFSCIIYLAALASISHEIYEAAIIDGAGRWKQMTNITLPSLLPTIIILMLFALGSLMSVSSDKILLLYNPSNYDTSDVIATYIYRRGIIGADFSFAAAISLFNTVINFIFLVSFNKLAKVFSEYSLW